MTKDPFLNLNLLSNSPLTLKPLLEFTDIELNDDNFLNNMADKLIKALIFDQQAYLNQYIEKKFADKNAKDRDDYTYIRQIRNNYKNLIPFVILPANSKSGTAENGKKYVNPSSSNLQDVAKVEKKFRADNNILGSLPGFYIITNSGRHWEFDKVNGNDQSHINASGRDDACGCYTIIGIIKDNKKFHTDAIRNLFKESLRIDPAQDFNIESINIDGGSNLLNSNSAREFVSLAIQKNQQLIEDKFQDNSQDMSDQISASLQRIKSKEQLESIDFRYAFTALEIDCYEVAQFNYSPQEEKESLKRQVVKNLVGGTKNKNIKNSEMQEFMAVLSSLDITNPQIEVENMQKLLEEKKQDFLKAKAAKIPNSSFYKPFSSARQEEFNAAKDAAKKAFLDITSGNSAFVDQKAIEIYQDHIKSQKFKRNPDGPYCGIGITVQKKELDMGNIHKTPALKITNIFDLSDERFTKADGQKISGKDIMQNNKALFITGFKSPNGTSMTPIEDVLNMLNWQKEVENIFRDEGIIQFEVYNDKTKKSEIYSCHRDKNRPFVTTNCKHAKQSLEKEGVIGDRYNPNKHDIPLEVVQKFNTAFISKCH
jgi:hypothetical protein